MMDPPNKPAHTGYNLCAGSDGKGFAYCLTADCQASHQRGH